MTIDATWHTMKTISIHPLLSPSAFQWSLNFYTTFDVEANSTRCLQQSLRLTTCMWKPTPLWRHMEINILVRTKFEKIHWSQCWSSQVEGASEHPFRNKLDDMMGSRPSIKISIIVFLFYTRMCMCTQTRFEFSNLDFISYSRCGKSFFHMMMSVSDNELECQFWIIFSMGHPPHY